MPQPAPRRVRLFRNNRSQAVRIPAEFALPGEEAIISRDGDRLVIEPVRRKGLTALLDSWGPWPKRCRRSPIPHRRPRTCSDPCSTCWTPTSSAR